MDVLYELEYVSNATSLPVVALHLCELLADLLNG